MPNFENHLANGFGMQRVEEQWLVAWDMSTRDTQKGTS
jgi:hypothetical protein